MVEDSGGFSGVFTAAGGDGVAGKLWAAAVRRKRCRGAPFWTPFGALEPSRRREHDGGAIRGGNRSEKVPGNATPSQFRSRDLQWWRVRQRMAEAANRSGRGGMGWGSSWCGPIVLGRPESMAIGGAKSGQNGFVGGFNSGNNRGKNWCQCDREEDGNILVVISGGEVAGKGRRRRLSWERGKGVTGREGELGKMDSGPQVLGPSVSGRSNL